MMRMGSKHTDDAKRKQSIAHKGLSTWNRGLPKEQQPYYAKTHSEKTKQAMSFARKNWHRLHPRENITVEGRKKISATLKRRPNTWGAKIGKALKGRSKSIIHRINLSESKKRMFREHPNLGLANAIRLRQKNKWKGTSIEMALRKELDQRNYAFRCNQELGFCQPDIVFSDQKIAIFADGDYWHNLPNYRERDSRINRQLREKGWLVLRYWEHEIKGNVEGCVDEIEDCLFQRGLRFG